jgi:hypothetical protein
MQEPQRKTPFDHFAFWANKTHAFLPVQNCAVLLLMQKKRAEKSPPS